MLLLHLAKASIQCSKPARASMQNTGGDAAHHAKNKRVPRLQITWQLASRVVLISWNGIRWTIALLPVGSAKVKREGWGGGEALHYLNCCSF